MVGVDDAFHVWGRLTDHPVKGISVQLGILTGVKELSDPATNTGIPHSAAVDFALSRRMLRDVADSELIEPRSVEVAFAQVVTGGHARVLTGLGRAGKPM